MNFFPHTFWPPVISGTTPRGDTGGGLSSACKHEIHGSSIPPSNIPGPPAAGPVLTEGAMLSGAAVVLYRYSGYA